MKALALLTIALITAPQGEEITLRFRPKKGEVYTYTTTTTVRSTTTGTAAGDGQNGTPTQSVVRSAMKVLESNGKTIKLLSTLDDVKSVSASGAQGMKMTLVMTPFGQLIGTEVEGGGEIGVMAGNALKSSMKLTPSFPEKPIRVGATWDVEIDLADMFANLFGDQMKVKGEAKANLAMSLTKIEVVEGTKLAVVNLKMAKDLIVTYNDQEIPVSWNVEVTSRINAATGMNVSQESRQSQTMKFGPEMTVTMNIDSVVNLEPKK